MYVRACSKSKLSVEDEAVVAAAVGYAEEVLGLESSEDSGRADRLCSDVRLYRSGFRMKLSELAEAAGITREDVWAVESGKLRDFDDDRVQKLLSIIDG